MPGASAKQKRTPGARPDDSRYVQQSRNVALSKLRRLHALSSKAPTSGLRPAPLMSSGQPTLTWTNTSDPSTVGLGQRWDLSQGKATTFGGAVAVSSPGYVLNSRWFSTANSAVLSPDFWAVEAVVHDSVAGFFCSGSFTNGIRVLVDGQLVSATQTTPGASGYNVLKIDFAGVRQPRRITIEGWGGGGVIVGLATSATGICTPTRPDPLKFMVLGDSVADGTGATWNGDGYARPLAQLLGVSDLRVSGDGGTGFTVVTGTGKQNYITRVADVIGNTPDILFTALSSNDYTTAAGTVVTAVGTYLDTIRAQYATMPIILSGSLWNDGNLTNAQAIETAVQAAVAARNDPWLKFINTKVIAGGKTQPIWGQGTTSAVTGSGNSDWAFAGGGVNHPTTEGHLYIARFLFEEIKRCLAEWLALAA